MTSLQNSNGHFFFRPNNKETLKEDLPNENNNNRYIKNYKLPNLKSKRKKKENIPLTDEENDNNSMDNLNNSPKIMKITRRSIEPEFELISRNQKIVDLEYNSKLNSTSVKSQPKLNRVKSLPAYDNP